MFLQCARAYEIAFEKETKETQNSPGSMTIDDDVFTEEYEFTENRENLAHARNNVYRPPFPPSIN